MAESFNKENWPRWGQPFGQIQRDRNMNRIHQLILLISFFFLFVFWSSTITCYPALALLREHHESPGVLRYHAQSSLKDRQGYTWQVVLFPERGIQAPDKTSEDSPSPVSSNSITKYHLRLVGFPGVAEFLHPQPLEIITANGEVFNAADLIAVQAPAPNVGEFDLTDILPLLPKKGSLKLAIWLNGDRDLAISIPESTIIEWQLLSNRKK
jgi:hypothetical protein